ncbi:MAG: LamG domain-containing protein [Chitinophagaceae bacterium]|nr:LamG domain-containing protein [Chitinophagaceae bacterium]MBL0057120.1 LamG domain-containing protein [Chitinophagaceae bacterium]
MKKIPYLFLIFFNTVFAQVNLSEGLKAYYPFSGNADDASGNNNNPVFNNTTFTNDRFGKPNSACHFNGIDNYIKIPNAPSLNFGRQITLFVWVRPTGFYHDVCHASSILTKGSGNYKPGTFALRFDDALYTEGEGCSGEMLKDSLHHNFRGTGTTLKPYTPYINRNEWYAVTYINDGMTAKLYVDCELKYAIDFKEIFTNRDDLYLGRLDDPYYPFWLNGDLDEVRIYDRVLNVAEMYALCDKKKDTVKIVPPPPPLVIADTPVIKTPDPVKEPPLEKRNKELIRQITVDHDSISVTLYDNGQIDGDTVTLIYNDKILATHRKLTDKPQTFIIKITPGNSRNELIMYAENLGSIPPNTALMVIYDGDKRYELNVSSSKTTNGAVSFRLRE